MKISEQMVQIRVDDHGKFTVIHFGSTFNDRSVLLSPAAKREVCAPGGLTPNKYRDAKIYAGNLDHDTETLMITHIKLC